MGNFGAVLLVELFVLLALLGLVVGLVVGVAALLLLTGVIVGGLRRSSSSTRIRATPITPSPDAPRPSSANATPSSGTTILLAVGALGGTIALGLAILAATPGLLVVGAFTKLYVSDYMAKAADRRMRDDLLALGAAETAYRSANGGFYDTPACLAHPGACIPGYTGPAFLDPERASLKPRGGYVLSFMPGLPAARDASEIARTSPSSLTGYAILAKSADPKERMYYCIDARARVCNSYEAVRKGVCACGTEGIGVRVQPLVIEFTHVVGESPCPQRVGSLEVFNETEREVTTDIRTSSPAPLSFGPNVTLGSRVSSGIDVFFTCAGKEDFNVEVVVPRPQDITPANTFESKATVYGTIVR